tara:strand:- start:21 stop:515 length:495 start_codon:yes stop_codon:yes gene_type:complete
MAFTEAEKKALRDRHAAFKRARKEGKLKEYQANKDKIKEHNEKNTKERLKERHKLWKTDRKAYNKKKREHITKQETKRYESAKGRTDAFNKEHKRGKYSERHKKTEEKLYGKNLTGVRKGLSALNPFKKESVKKANLKIKTDKEREKKRKNKTISSRVDAEMKR